MTTRSRRWRLAIALIVVLNASYPVIAAADDSWYQAQAAARAVLDSTGR
jgi:hypothetical protein